MFVEEMYPDRKVTKDDFRRTIPLLSYYGISAYLRDNGLIELHTVNDKNQKVWCLTDKGKKFASLVMEMKKILNNGMTEKTITKIKNVREALVEDN
jgi:DNA-binding HxlR family transcriptional regulator